MPAARGPLILALDQGTSSSRAIVFDQRAVPVGAAQYEVATRFPQPGWVEQDADELITSQLRAARDALAAAGAEAGEVAAIGIANQRETVVAWEPSGGPAAPAIVWQDRRTSDRCTALRAAGQEGVVRARTGLLLDPYFSATKVAWLLDHLPDARRRAESGDLVFGTVDAYLLWRLTAGRSFATDVSNASRTLLLDLRERIWAPQMLELFGVPRRALPDVQPTDHEFGWTDPDLLGAALPVRAMVGDQQAALFGQGCLTPGAAKNTYGTGCFLLMTTGADPPMPPEGLVATVAWERESFGAEPAEQGRPHVRYALEGSVFVAGAAVRWLRDGLGIIRSAEEVEPLAASVPDTGGVVVVPAFSGLGAPYWDPDARGAILGVTAGTSAGHIARATLEAIAQQTADLVEALERGGAPPLASLRADGGAAANDILLQLQADLLGRPVERAAIAETTALGAALLAGRAAGVLSNDEELASIVNPGRVFEPTQSDAWRREKRDRWAEAVARTRTRR